MPGWEPVTPTCWCLLSVPDPPPPAPVPAKRASSSSTEVSGASARDQAGAMDAEVAGGVAWARGGGNRAAEREQVLRDGRRLAAERELERMSGSFFIFTATLMVFLARSSDHPWVSRARGTGEQMLRARLYDLLKISAYAVGAALVGVLCAHKMQMRAAPPAEPALAAVWALFCAFNALFMAFIAVARSENWGETAAWCCIIFASAAVACLCSRWLVCLVECRMERLRLRLERSMVDGC